MADLAPQRTALVLGANGQLGMALREAVDQGAARNLAQHWIWSDRQHCDLSRPEALAHSLRALSIDVIFNAAAYTAVDRAESEPDLAQRVNAESVRVLAEFAQERHIPLVHYSTDYVFDGTLNRPYQETDPTGPQSAYGRSKLAGEQAVQSLLKRHLLIRSSWVFARHGGNFIKTILRLAQEREQLRVVADQFGTPTSARCLARQSLHACSVALGAPSDAAPWGLYHLSCAGATDWHSYAAHVLARASQWGAPLKVHAPQVQAISSDQYPTPAPRPRNSRLDCARWSSTFGATLPDWRSEVDAVLADILLDQGVLTPAMRTKITSERSAQ